MHDPVMTADEVSVFLAREFPQMHVDGEVFFLEAVRPGRATVRLEPLDRHLRPGGTVSGPTLFTLADVGAYVVVLAHVGPRALAVTTNLTIDFLHRATPGPITGEARILKLGKRLVVVACEMRDTDGRMIAHATATYSVPPR